jgi:ABC-type transporter Mla MlaB component
MRTQRFDATTTLSADRRFAVLAIAGELDLGTAEQLWPSLERLLTPASRGAAVRDALDTPGAPGPPTAPDGVVLDATGLEFLDSSGLRVLLRGAKLAEDEGTAFRVVAPDPVVQRVLELSGAALALDLRPSLAEAFA